MLAYEDAPGPAASAHRPSSMAVPATQHSSASASRSDSQRKRASHAPTSSATSQNNENSFHGGQLPVRDVYSHPAALQFQHAHPRRVIPRFGPYLLLQTIGEGEFGKVKLGLHSEYGEEVAVKLIRRGSVDNTVRMSKVEREIDVLKVIRHPNIVRLFDVIETDKYIGIVLEYASGGELFDHILAHRCLKEKDACRLFAQLISGVAYIHAKKIVHRDLKLENLLLDRNRNVIISDFGFANRFEHKSDDLMQTSCGSPCYAAPELVISEGMYVGSAVDIWSCGVILYAMLAGYLPFDDDPANPDGDNINLLYKYIINTPLTFPDYISEEARDLLSRMLVPDPTHRATLQTIMDHRWLRAYRHFFDRSVDEHEAEAMLQHQQKREEYARKLRLKSATGEEDQAAAHHREHRERRHRERGDRTALADVTAPPSAFSGAAGASDSALASNPYVDQNMEIDSSQNAQRRAHAVSAIVMPTQRKRERSQPPADIDLDYPTSSVAQPAPAQIVPLPSDDQPREKKKRTKHADRHTIQVEYDDPEAPPARPPIPMPTSSATADVFSEKDQGSQPTQQRQRTGSTPPVAMLHAFNTSPKQEKTQLAPKERSSKDQASRESMPTPSSESRSTPKIAPIPIAPAPVVATSSPVTTPSQPSSIGPQRSGSQRATNGKSSRARASLDRLGLGKVFGTQPSPEPAPLPPSVTPTEATATTSVSRSESLSTRPPTEDESSNQDHSSTADTTVNASDSGFSKIKRRTLNLVVGSGRSDRKVSSRTSKPVVDKEAPPASAIEPPSKANGHFPARDIVPPSLEHTGNAASTSKAKKVMDWFRTRSQTRGQPSSVTSPSTELLSSVAGPRSAAPQLVITTPRDGSAGTNPATAADSLATPTTPYIQSSLSQRIAHALTPTLRSNSSPIVANPVTPPVVTPPNPVMALRVHHGAVDQGTVTTGHPAEVFAHVRTVLQEMGMELQKESEYKYRCIRPKRKKAGAASASGSPNPGAASTPPTSPSGGVAAYTMVGSASLNGIDKRGLPHPSGMLRGLLTRRASSHISDVDDDVRSPTGPQALPATEGVDTIYGDRTVDLADEVRFSVELTRIDRLDDTLSLDIRRLKGNLRSYKFVYDTLRDRCAFSV